MKLLKASLLLFCFCFLNLHSFSQSSLLNSDVELFELTWPGDDMLCDSYQYSEGPMSFRVYRLSSTKKMIRVDEIGAYCQGDSEYASSYTFNEKGEAMYSVEGGNMYVPTTITLYDSAKAFIEVEYEASEDQVKFLKRTIKKLKSKEQITSDYFEQLIFSYFEKMQKRIDTLKQMTFGKKDASMKTEAESLVVVLQGSLDRGIVYTPGYIYRVAQKGEYTLLKGTDIRVRESASSKSKVLGKVNSYDGDFLIDDISTAENIDPYGTYHWYKIKYQDQDTGKNMEGWIFGAFILPGVFPK